MIEITSGFGGIADVNEGASLTDNDVNDPKRRTLMVTSAPILKSLRRMVPQVA